jgi:hypothetical protein
VTAFLGENYTHFMADDALEEAAEAAAHLSNAGVFGTACLCVGLVVGQVQGSGLSVSTADDIAAWIGYS